MHRRLWAEVFWVLFLIPSGLAGILFAQVRIKPHVYLGGGLGITMEVKDQDFAVEDGIDQNYIGFNYSTKQRAFTRGQIRLNLLEVDRFSIGYTFWAHNRKYASENSEYWVKKGKSYPYNDDLNLHAAILQWDLRYAVVSAKYFVPYLLVGAGQYYGSSRSFQFEFIDDVYYYYDKKLITQDKKYSGNAWLYGGGFIFLKYAYFYVGMVDFGKNAVPVRRALDCVLGIRI